ncbi:transcriptional regulator NrdR [Mycobacterium tuberculosis]|nr:transcriptional regulator NrdR [Mycobacterium tuberculosis]
MISGVRRACQGRQVDDDALKAYLRFASVYRSFSSADDFAREIEALRAHRNLSAHS